MVVVQVLAATVRGFRPLLLDPNQDKPRQNKLCWLSRGGQFPRPWERVSLKECIRSPQPSNVVCKTAFPRVFDLANRVTTDTGGEFLGRAANRHGRSGMIGHLNRCRLV